MCQVFTKWVSIKNIRYFKISAKLFTSQASVADIYQKSTKTVYPLVDPDWHAAKPYSKIPGPSFYELITIFGPWGKLKNASFLDIQIEFQRKYGGIVKMPGIMGKEDMIFVYDPSLFEKIFRTEGQFPIRRGTDSFVCYRQKRYEVFNGLLGVAQAQGESWWQTRKVINSVMMKSKLTKEYIPMVDQVTKEFVQRIHSLRDDNQEVPGDFYFELNKWAMEAIAVISMGTRIGVMNNEKNPESEKFMNTFKEIFKLIFELDFKPSIWKIFPTPTFKRLIVCLDEITNRIKKIIDAELEKLEKMENSPTGEKGVLEKLLKIDRSIAIVMVLDNLFAGADPVSAVCSSFLYLLAKNPEKQEKLRNEMISILPEKDSPITIDNTINLPYLRACLKEVLRLKPIAAGNLRGTGRDIVLNGYQIPKNKNIIMASNILHLQEKYFERAQEFIPERWLRNQTEVDCPFEKKKNSFVFLPFGFGVRMCVGKRFAEIEIESLICRLVRNYKIEFHYPEPKLAYSIINIPTGEMKFRLIDI